MPYDYSIISSYYCKQHRTYKGLGRPRLPCEACWWLYFASRGALWTQGVHGLSNRNADAAVKLTRQRPRGRSVTDALEVPPWTE